jgi:hypothetical protein
MIGMSIVTLLVTLVVIGILLWAINEYLPLHAGIKRLINIVVIVVVVLWLLQVFGIIDYAEDIQVPQVK